MYNQTKFLYVKKSYIKMCLINFKKVSMICTKRKKSAFDGAVKNTGMPKDKF